jgi:hypothetical protein
METIRRCLASDYEKLTAFNRQVFPDRNIDAGALMDFRYKRRENSGYEECVIVTDGKEVLGQVLLSSTYCTCKGKRYDGTFYADTMVRADQRERGYGLMLMKESLNTGKQQWSAGSTAFQVKRRLKLGMKIMGERRLYVKTNNIFSLFGRNVPDSTIFPEVVSSFLLLSKENVGAEWGVYNHDLVEFGRDEAFIRWRFFDAIHKYYMYKDRGSRDYFVVRIIKKKGVPMLCLADYRCDFSNAQSFNYIVHAVNTLAKKLRIPFTITSSSLNISDHVLEKNGYISVANNNAIRWFNYIRKKIFNKRPKGEDGVVFAYNMDEIIDQDLIDKRKYVFITLADSDGEILW